MVKSTGQRPGGSTERAATVTTGYGHVPSRSGQERRRPVSEQRTPPATPDRFPYYLSAALQVLRWIFWLAALYIGLSGLEPLLALIAGEETIFEFNAAFSI